MADKLKAAYLARIAKLDQQAAALAEEKATLEAAIENLKHYHKHAIVGAVASDAEHQALIDALGPEKMSALVDGTNQRIAAHKARYQDQNDPQLLAAIEDEKLKMSIQFMFKVQMPEREA